MNTYVICMDSVWVRDSEMFDIVGLTDEELTDIDMCLFQLFYFTGQCRNFKRAIYIRRFIFRFLILSITDFRNRPIQTLKEVFSELYDQKKTIDDIILDLVIMAPSMVEPLDDLNWQDAW